MNLSELKYLSSFKCIIKRVNVSSDERKYLKRKYISYLILYYLFKINIEGVLVL